MTLKFNKFLRSVTTDLSAASLLGLCEHFAQFPRCEGEGHKCSQVDAEKYNRFFVFQDSSIPDVYGDICPCVCNHQTAYIAYWHLYCFKFSVLKILFILFICGGSNQDIV